MIAQQFLAEVGEKHTVSEAVFLIDGAQSLQATCHRAGYDSSGSAEFFDVKHSDIASDQYLDLIVEKITNGEPVSLFDFE